MSWNFNFLEIALFLLQPVPYVKPYAYVYMYMWLGMKIRSHPIIIVIHAPSTISSIASSASVPSEMEVARQGGVQTSDTES